MAVMKCGRCGSEKIMPNLRIRDRYDAGVGRDLEVEVQGNPDALIFKQAHREALRATVCGECGNVGLSVENPEALWKIYTEKRIRRIDFYTSLTIDVSAQPKTTSTNKYLHI